MASKDWALHPISHPIVQVKNGYSYELFKDQSEELLRKYELLTQEKIGESVLEKSIYVFRLGTGPVNIHINAAVHANEWITAPLLLRFLEQLAASAVSGDQKFRTEVASWFSKVTLWAVPMVNPDGVDLSQDGIPRSCPYEQDLAQWNDGKSDFSRWKANIRGVDLNDQFPAFWEAERERRMVSGPAPQDYSGPSPLSEPEAVALAELTRAQKFDRVMSLHSQGREIYWNYRDFEPSESEGLAERLAKSGGYLAVKLSGSDAGYKDWFIHEFRRPGFTVEVGEGVNPLPPEQFESIYQELAPILTEFIRG